MWAPVHTSNFVCIPRFGVRESTVPGRNSSKKSLKYAQTRSVSHFYPKFSQQRLQVCGSQLPATGLKQIHPQVSQNDSQNNSSVGSHFGVQVEEPNGFQHARNINGHISPTHETAQNAAGKSRKPQKLLEMEATVSSLQKMEENAALTHQYKLADRLHRAVSSLTAMQVEYMELRSAEAQAVRRRDYLEASGATKRQAALLRHFDSLRSRDYTKDGKDVEADGHEVLETGVVAVRFHLTQETEFGDNLVIVGSLPELGAWKLEDGMKMQWTNGDRWVCHTELPLGVNFEFKFVITNDQSGEQRWQEGCNRGVELPAEPMHKVDITGSWERNELVELVWMCMPLKCTEIE